jgi:hypothetical protein
MRSKQRPLARALAVAILLMMVPVPLDPGQWATVPPYDREAPAVLLISSVPTAWADSDEFEIDDIGRVKRGEEKVKVLVDVKQSGLICLLKLKYPDGNADSIDKVESDKKGICEITFDVPDRKSAVGDAIAKLKVETKKGSDKGKATRYFYVRDKRGG